MQKIVSAADASRRFSELLRGVRKGRTYVVTSHGRAVAKLIPAERDERHVAAARAVLLARLKSQPASKDDKARNRCARNDLYKDE